MEKHIGRKVSIIGAGNVGATTAFALINSGLVTEIALLDKNEEKAEGQVMDLMHGVPFGRPVKVYTGGYGVIEDSDVIIIAAGTNITKGVSRLELVHKNTEVMKDIVNNIKDFIGNALILVVSNPVDIMAYVLQKLTGLPKERVIGSGTVLDTARFKSLVGQHLNVDSRDVRGYILGEHGDSEFATWSSTNIAGIKMEEFCNQTKICTPDTTKDIIENDVKYAGYEVINKKGATDYAISMATTRIIESILLNENAVLTVSTLLTGEYGLNDVYLSVPCIVNKDGVDRIMIMPLSERETYKLNNSANVLKDIIESVKI